MSDLTSQYIIAQEEHDYNKKYEEGTIVKHTTDGVTTAYIAKKNVPQFISILNENYWKKIASTASSGGGGVDIFDEDVVATDAQRNKALANISNQTSNSTTGKIGYKVLDGSKSFTSQVTGANTIYEIRDVFNLDGDSVNIPAGCTLKFNGGKITNGEIIGNNSIVNANETLIFDDVVVSGIWNCVGIAEWFAPICTFSDDSLYPTIIDATTGLQCAFDAAFSELRFGGHVFYISDTLIIRSSKHIFSDNDVICSPNYCRINKKYVNGKTVVFTDLDIPIVRIYNEDYSELYKIANVLIDGINFAVKSNSNIFYTNNAIVVDTSNGRKYNLRFNIGVCSRNDGSNNNSLGTAIYFTRAIGGYITNVRINGFISGFAKALAFEDNETDGWFTDITLSSVIVRTAQAIVGNGDCIFDGSFQTGVISSTNPMLPVFDTKTVDINGIVWDLSSFGNINNRQYILAHIRKDGNVVLGKWVKKFNLCNKITGYKTEFNKRYIIGGSNYNAQIQDPARDLLYANDKTNFANVSVIKHTQIGDTNITPPSISLRRLFYEYYTPRVQLYNGDVLSNNEYIDIIVDVSSTPTYYIFTNIQMTLSADSDCLCSVYVTYNSNLIKVSESELDKGIIFSDVFDSRVSNIIIRISGNDITKIYGYNLKLYGYINDSTSIGDYKNYGNKFITIAGGTLYGDIYNSDDNVIMPTSLGGATRPSTPAIGLTFFDTTLNKLIVWNGTAWVNPDGTLLIEIQG